MKLKLKILAFCLSQCIHYLRHMDDFTFSVSEGKLDQITKNDGVVQTSVSGFMTTKNGENDWTLTISEK